MWDLLKQYLTLGFTHVIPLGFDHILFILSIFFLNSELRSVIIQCTLFTLAHSLTLSLAALGHITADPQLVEPVIAFSILIASLENILYNKLNLWRYGLIFLFGLVHGLGFANALSEIGLPENDLVPALLFFNTGVEIAQICVIFIAWFGVAKWLRNKPWYRTRIVYPVSAIIACIALYWTLERIISPG